MRPWPVWIMLSACSGWGDKDAVETGGWGAEDCAWTPAAAGEVAVREECLGGEPTAVEDPWNIAPEWSYTDPGGGIWVMPAVGSVTDDNGDGLADLRDTPDIVAATRGFTLVLLDGVETRIAIPSPTNS